MGSLLFNTLLHEHLKVRIKFTLSILPFSLMFAVPVLSVSIEEVYKGFFEDVGFWIFGIFMVVGFYLGWSLNKVVAKLYGKWSLDQINKVLSMSEVPMEWYRKNGFSEYKALVEEELASTSTEHQSNMFVALRAGLIFYFFIGLSVVVFNPFIEGRAITQWNFFIWPAPLYAIAIGASVLISLKYSESKNIKDKQYFHSSSYFNEEVALQNDSINSTYPDYLNNTLAKIQLFVGIVISVFLIVLGGGMLNYALTDDTFDIPSKPELRLASGTLAKVEEKEEYITFRLEHSKSSDFDYLKRSGSYDYVSDVLTASEGKNISVLFTNHSEGRLVVYELKTEEKEIRLFEQSKRSLQIWRIISTVMSLIILIGGVFCVFGSWIEFKANKEN